MRRLPLAPPADRNDDTDKHTETRTDDFTPQTHIETSWQTS